MSVTQNSAQEEREKYVMAFNDTMIKIWKEQITLLDVMDTKSLLRSPISLPVRADGRFFEVGLSSLPGIWSLARLRHGKGDTKRQQR